MSSGAAASGAVVPPGAAEPAAAASGAAAPDGDTAEFALFLQRRVQLPTSSREETANGYCYRLNQGSLSIVSDDGGEAQIWQSDPYWWVEDFALADVDGDGSIDLLFSLWKSWSFGITPPIGQTDSPAVRNHLFLYSIKGGWPQSLWCSSNLPRPIYSFSLSADGEQTPTRSGVLLRTIEGRYQEDLSVVQADEYSYAWEKWGFVELQGSTD